MASKHLVVLNFFHDSIEESDALIKALGDVQERVIRSKLADQKNEDRHTEWMRTRNEPALRSGRGDSGYQVFGSNGLNGVTLVMFLRNLLMDGMKIVQTLRERKPKRKNGKIVPNQFKYVVEIHFACDEEPIPNDARTTTGLMVYCETMSFNICHVWDNGGRINVILTGGTSSIKSAGIALVWMDDTVDYRAIREGQIAARL